MDKITFIASLPAIQSAILISGDGNGAKIKLEVPQREIMEILKLSSLYGKCLRVTIETED